MKARVAQEQDRESATFPHRPGHVEESDFPDIYTSSQGKDIFTLTPVLRGSADRQVR